MRIVRTVGQAFEVCHKLSLQHTEQSGDGGEEGESEKSSDDSGVPVTHAVASVDHAVDETDIDALDTVPPRDEGPEFSRGVTDLDTVLRESDRTKDKKEQVISASPKMLLPYGSPLPPGTPLSVHHQIQLLQQQLQQQQQQTQVAVAQVHLLKDQLSAEAAARLESQARVHQLLLQNKDLLQHISLLVRQVQELEVRLSGHHTMGSQDSLLEITFRSSVVPVLCDPSTPRPEDLPPLTDGSDLSYQLSNPLGRTDCLVKVQCYRFVPGAGQGSGELLGSLELYRFRESGIASDYESNTDENDGKEPWAQEEGGRLAHVLHRDMLGDSLEDEIAV
ncbi:carboxyl-terminal PDZ ligand of neuronal nitric oxide synthase protein isoform X2 [Ascaphus truei]|uniref:carboxyl-terminal PDZ ligand of neuronal nitric oxide synthase protein isoform X2 n=1 Tax=Ascaphus truei TaxID=8439 RepID=UPI003F598EE1